MLIGDSSSKKIDTTHMPAPVKLTPSKNFLDARAIPTLDHNAAHHCVAIIHIDIGVDLYKADITF